MLLWNKSMYLPYYEKDSQRNWYIRNFRAFLKSTQDVQITKLWNEIKTTQLVLSNFHFTLMNALLYVYSLTDVKKVYRYFVTSTDLINGILYLLTKFIGHIQTFLHKQKNLIKMHSLIFPKWSQVATKLCPFVVIVLNLIKNHQELK